MLRTEAADCRDWGTGSHTQASAGPFSHMEADTASSCTNHELTQDG